MEKYRWAITRDHIAERTGDESTVGTSGPYGADEAIITNPVQWYAYDDDGELYYEGMLYGDYEGLEPLDDFCMPYAGCTAIKINGEWV